MQNVVLVGNFTIEGSNLAEYLANRGFDVWMMEYRGDRSSVPPDEVTWRRGAWNIDDIARHDVPAALAWLSAGAASDADGHAEHWAHRAALGPHNATADAIKARDGEEHPLFQAIRADGVKREPILLTETLRAVARGEITVGSSYGPMDLSDAVEARLSR